MSNIKAMIDNEIFDNNFSSLIQEQLLFKNWVKPAELKRVQELHVGNSISTSVLLVRFGLVSAQDMADLQQSVTGLPMMEEVDMLEAPIATDLFSDKFLRNAFAIVLNDAKDHITVAGVKSSKAGSGKITIKNDNS